MNSKTWEEVRLFYQERFDIDPEFVDIAADMEILKLFVSGSSNKNISAVLDISTPVVESTIERYFHYKGWEEDLPISPISIYRNNSDFTIFKWKFGNSNQEVVLVAYDSCSIYDEMEMLINEHWV